MKLFGFDLFKHKTPMGPMYDFAQHGITNPPNYRNFDIAAVAVSTPEEAESAKKLLEKKKVKKEETIAITPKGVYHMKMLHDNDFKIKTDKEYIEKQVSLIDEKLDLIGKPPKTSRGRGRHEYIEFAEMGGVRYGREELQSIKERLLARYKLVDEKADWQRIFNEYPHTTNELIQNVLAANTHLSCKLAKEFVPDFPHEAVDAMKKYNKMCIEVCGRESVFYVVAQHKDFEKKDRRRDPILLAQSPFGFFWQILGAWDEEMVLLDEL